ncbi:MAG: 16S rRNA (cytidine(1402)-2'-O)-methyltransferase [Desulfobacterota bacterium]|nr:16S rRNA (cytidine(1402)-2'-O)-methyltransferase [Thermodesulfobacteriota bacterium]
MAHSIEHREKGCLYVVSTPIGHLEDITLRALRVLKEVDLIAAEDTRRTLQLLNHYGIRTPLTSYFEGNEMKKRALILERLNRGERVALVSDAGTPGISDPGYRLIRLAVDHAIPVVAVPGPSALIAALSISGLPTDAFLFKGFLPHRPTRRRNVLKELEETRETLIFYESPHRLAETLKDIFEVLGDREIVLARELTKLFEEVLRGKVSEIRQRLAEKKVKGEVTLVVSGKVRRSPPKKRPSMPERPGEDHEDGEDLQPSDEH